MMIPDQYPNYYKEIYTGNFDSLDIMILFSYPSSIVITRDYCNTALIKTEDLKENVVIITLWYDSVHVLEPYNNEKKQPVKCYTIMSVLEDHMGQHSSFDRKIPNRMGQ